MIFSDFLKAVGQLPDRRFQGVLWLGIGLTLALLVAIYAGLVWLIQLTVPDTLSLPWIGEIGGIDSLLSIGAIPVMLILSVFLMVPVASVFMGLFIEWISEAVEAKHYPHLPPAKGLGLWEGLRDALGLFVVLILLSLLTLVASLFLGPFGPIFAALVNGFLLGREYFTLAAARRIGLEAARSLRQRHSLQIWLAGTLMALPLAIPVVNLLIPVLGVATFTHMYHRLSGTSSRQAL